MKIRPLILVILLVGGFWFVTTHLPVGLAHSSLGRSSIFGGHASNSPLELQEAEAAPTYDAEEQNNIAVYKRVLPSVVNITSTTLVFNFFYGTVPQAGFGIHSRQSRAHLDQLPRGGGRESRHRGADEQQAALRSQGGGHGSGARPGAAAD
jgi:hypothetical protein